MLHEFDGAGNLVHPDGFDDGLRLLLYGGYVYYNEAGEISHVNGFHTVAAGDKHGELVTTNPVRKEMCFQRGRPLPDKIDAVLQQQQR